MDSYVRSYTEFVPAAKPTINTATYNILSTDLIIDICENPIEYTTRYDKSLDKIFTNAGTHTLDFICLQEGDPHFNNRLQLRLETQTNFEVLSHFMGPQSGPHTKQLYILFNVDNWNMVTDLTPDLQSKYSINNGQHPYRAQLALFGNVITGEQILIGNIHASGVSKYRSITKELYFWIFDYIIRSNPYAPLIISGDVYQSKPLVTEVVADIVELYGSIPYTLNLECHTPERNTTSHNFVFADKITYDNRINPYKKYTPELICYSENFLKPTTHVILPSEDELIQPYRYDEDCLRKHDLSDLSYTQLNKCRKSKSKRSKSKSKRSKSKSKRKSRGRGRGRGRGGIDRPRECYNHRDDYTLNWPSDHAFIITKFQRGDF